jgi:hypothetical protein
MSWFHITLLAHWFFTVRFMRKTFTSSFLFPYCSSLYSVLCLISGQMLWQGGWAVRRSDVFLQKKIEEST